MDSCGVSKPLSAGLSNSNLKTELLFQVRFSPDVPHPAQRQK